MNGWMDSLSEDWVSQPRSRSDSPPQTPPLPNITSSADAGHGRQQAAREQKQENATPVSQSGSVKSKRGSIHRKSQSQPALRERPLNHATPSSESGRKKATPRSRSNLSSSNASKTGSMQLRGTVYHKASKGSPERKEKSSGDPEWRQRLLGQGGPDSATRDLFSPIRLENMFQPPSSRPVSRLPIPERRGGQPFKPASPRVPAPPRADQKRDEAKEAAPVAAQEDTPVELNDASPTSRKQVMRDESRKGSVQTRDFLDEAERVMEFIRARGKPPPTEGSQLGRHASEVPGMSDIEEQSGDDTLSGGERDTTVEQFSRPPSRENRRAPDPVAVVQIDPQVMNRLQAYAEVSGLDIITDPSMESLVRAQRAEEFSDVSIPRHLTQGIVYAENPELNIRITDSSTEAREIELLPEEEQPKQDATEAPNSFGQPSGGGSGTSTARSLQTGSSARSDTKLVIAPQAVSHLISGEIAGMTFDQAKQTWVKRKYMLVDELKLEEVSKAGESTEDPLQNIPDLTVDEIEEQQTMRININSNDGKHHIQLSSKSMVSVSQQHPDERNGSEEHPVDEILQGEADEGILELLQHSNSEVGAPVEPISALPSEKVQEPANRGHDSDEVPQPPIKELVQSQADGVRPNEAEEEVDEEIQAHESRALPGLGYGNFKRRPKREVTITFSSPLVSHSFQIPPHSPSVEGDSPPRNDHPLATGSLFETEVEDPHRAQFAHVDDDQSHSIIIPQRSTFRRTSRISFSARPSANSSFVQAEQHQRFQRIVSNDVAISRRHSYAVNVSTPLRQQKARRNASVADVSALEHFPHVTFHLTPLPDFTVHQPGERLGIEASLLERGHKHARDAEGSRALALTTTDLVRRLTDLEPYEPYWECIRQLDLGSAGLTTLHGLKDYCGRVEKLDASKNRISQLNGAPSTIRLLRASNNCLSSLTAWGHLTNLQYLDISSNEIDSFVALRGLVHLREIKADNNIISSLEGILHLDGLIKLDIRHNDFRDLDLTDATLDNLKTIEASANCITQVRNLHQLQLLESLNLDDNTLSTLTLPASMPLPHLHTLRLERNRLASLDVSNFPGLRELHLDGNQLQTIDGLGTLQHLECLSIREQEEDLTVGPGSSKDQILSNCSDIRHLYLSSNLPPSLNPNITFLNLQHLELASCGLQTLPPTLSKMLPNLRTLNLNFNALIDISPLAGITRLSKLKLAGNRITRMRKTIRVLSSLRSLKEVDLRHNPLTHGFYSLGMSSGRPRSKASAPDDPDAQNAIEEVIEPFTLPPDDVEADENFRRKVDPDTNLRRNVYEKIMGYWCSSVRIVDGLLFNRSRVMKRDEVYDRLVKLKVLRTRRVQTDDGGGGGGGGSQDGRGPALVGNAA